MTQESSLWKSSLECREDEKRSTNPLRRRVFLSVLGGLAILSIAYYALPQMWYQNRTCYCGTSNEEAMRLGCRYDHLAVDWLPPHCIDQSLTDEFDRTGPGTGGSWPYFADWEGGIVVEDIDEFARLGKTVYTTKEWHIAHCLFTWRKQFRAAYYGRDMETWNYDEGHINHCLRYIMSNDSSLREIDTRIRGVDRHTQEERLE